MMKRELIATLLLLIGLALLPLAAWSQDPHAYTPGEETMCDAPGALPQFNYHHREDGTDWIVTKNNVTSYYCNGKISHWQVETPHGPVTVEYTSTEEKWCGPGGCDDKVEVVSLPDGYVAVPVSINIKEHGLGAIQLMPYAGG